MGLALKNLVNENAKHVFLRRDGCQYAFLLIRVEDQLLYFMCQEALPGIFDSGFVSAPQGILQFSAPIIEALPHKTLTKDQVYKIDFADLKYKIFTRRTEERYPLTHYLPISFWHFGEVLPARLVNISENGLRLSVATPLACQTSCQLEIRVPQTDKSIPPTIFQSMAIVVYVEAQNDIYDVGLSFVSAEFENPQDYKSARATLIQYVMALQPSAG